MLVKLVIEPEDKNTTVSMETDGHCDGSLGVARSRKQALLKARATLNRALRLVKKEIDQE